MSTGEKETGLQFDPHSFEGFARLGLHLEPVKNLLKHIDFKRGETIVDLGAGTGLSTQTIINAIPGDFLPTDRIILVEPTADIEVAKRRLEGYRQVEFFRGREDEFLKKLDGEVDQIHFHNALHLLPAEGKSRFVSSAFKALRQGGITAMVSTFIDGGEPEEERPFYQSWLIQSLRDLKNKYREVYDKVTVKLREAKAEARKRLSPADYKDLYEGAHFNIVHFDDDSKEAKMPITYEGFRQISSYSLWDEGILPGAPYDIATEVLQKALKEVWSRFKGEDDVSPRNCVLLIAQKPESVSL